MFDRTYVKPRRLFLARHGESEGNQRKIISGQLDVSLTAKGKNQAQWLCDVLKNERLSAVYASNLTRALETARPTADYHNIKIQAVDNLKEIHFGVLQGRSPNEPDTQTKALWLACEADKAFVAPGGESFHDFQKRILDCLALLLPSLPDNALLVAHRNTNQVILSKLLGRNADNGKAINVKNKYLYEIELGSTTSVNTIRLGGEFHGKKYPGLKDD